MFVADTVRTIKEKEDSKVTMRMFRRLDEMLNEANVQHFFSLPVESKNGLVNDEDYASVWYDSSDSMTFNHVFSLWCKVVRASRFL